MRVFLAEHHLLAFLISLSALPFVTQSLPIAGRFVEGS